MSTKHNKFVVFENEGTLDPRAIKTFGVSVKETENPIGFFGTGLKYAIAILMRDGHFAAIISGQEHYTFEVRNVEVRGKSFEMITMNGEELPFTTRLGVNWKTWQAFREIYCNCIDEGGKVYLADTVPEPQDGKTFFIAGGRDLELCYHTRHEIVLKLPEALRLTEGAVEIFNQPSKYLYYRGIRVLEFPKPALQTYNILEELELTEDRTVKHESWALNKIPKAVASMKSKGAIRTTLTAPVVYQESDFNYNELKYSAVDPSEEFSSILNEEYQTNNDLLNKSARDYNMRMLAKRSVKNFESEELTTVETKQLERANMVCSKLYKDFGKYKIIIVKHLGNETMAMADREERAIVLSKACFKMGTKYLVSTMIEEHVHLETGFHDCTRNLQTHLFDTICTLVEDYVLQEPI